ncbi:MAG: site-2 protease family protein [Magnetococcales bacterium]|nr:site-2 protease family protein [Magnetococcales bacterium]
MTIAWQDIVWNVLIWGPGVLLGATFHEWAHGFVADRFGDPTPRQHGRLTLNPLPHIDPVWTILVPLVMVVVTSYTMNQPIAFGGAKPVPINVGLFRGSKRLGLFCVALAGPAMNLLLAYLSALMLAQVVSHGGFMPYLVTVLGGILIASIKMNGVLALFNLIPLPPLDGGRIVQSVLPAAAQGFWMSLERFGMPLIILLVMTGGFGSLLHGPLRYLLRQFYAIAGLSV